jgi:N6-adenosine-specific RNA methylase IME4
LPDGVTIKMIDLGGIAVSDRRLRKLRPEVVAELAASIREQGLLQPIRLRPRSRGGSGYILVAGRHRLEAVRSLGLNNIRAEICDDMKADEALLAEIDENLMRAELSAAERAAHHKARKPLYLKLHPETKKGGVPGAGRGRGKKKGLEERQNVAYAKDVAKKTGKKNRTVEREVARGEHIDAEVLANIADTSLDQGDELDALAKLPEAEQLALAERASAGEKVSAKTRAKQISRDRREAELGAKIIAFPTKQYGVIVTDPEWHDEVWSEETGMDRHPSNHYPTSPVEEIAFRKVADIAAPDCVLFLWTTNQHLRIALGVMEAWGFAYKSNYVWGKDRAGTGRWNRSKHEILLIGTRGSPPCPAPGTQRDSLIMAPRGEHSAKPECFLEMIEQYYPTIPKIELNRRGAARAGWDAWGNEVHEPEAVA